MARQDLTLPRVLPYKRPREATSSPSASERLKEVRGQDLPQPGAPRESSAERLGKFVERRRGEERLQRAEAQTPGRGPSEPLSSSAQRMRAFVEERQLAVAQAIDKADQMEQLQAAALQARLGELLGNSPPSESPEQDEEGGRLKRLDMRSELLARRIAILLKKHAPKVELL